MPGVAGRDSASVVDSAGLANSLPLRTWIRSVFFGWVLGIVVVIFLAVIGDAIGARGSQLAVGLGMGLGVGFTQERALRPVTGALTRWPGVSALGLALPFLFGDVSRLIGIGIPYSLYGTIVIAGLVIGTFQSRLLPPAVASRGAWILANVVGWTLAAVSVAWADTFTRTLGVRGIAGALIYLGVVASGGVALGLATGLALRRSRAS